jgi:hypothetical protein
MVYLYQNCVYCKQTVVYLISLYIIRTEHSVTSMHITRCAEQNVGLHVTCRSYFLLFLIFIKF